MAGSDPPSSDGPADTRADLSDVPASPPRPRRIRGPADLLAPSLPPPPSGVSLPPESDPEDPDAPAEADAEHVPGAPLLPRLPPVGDDDPTPTSPAPPLTRHRPPPSVEVEEPAPSPPPSSASAPRKRHQPRPRRHLELPADVPRGGPGRPPSLPEGERHPPASVPLVHADPVARLERLGRVRAPRVFLTPEVIEVVAETIAAGARDVGIVAAAIGVRAQTLHEWMAKAEADAQQAETCESIYVQFGTAVAIAQARAKVSAQVRVHQGATEWRGPAWWLERTDPEGFGQRQRFEHTGPQGGPVQVAPARVDLPAELPD